MDARRILIPIFRAIEDGAGRVLTLLDAEPSRDALLTRRGPSAVGTRLEELRKDLLASTPRPSDTDED
ncbi:hypothetical protein [Antrihabitans stalactiti]|uniref:Uncharacterized protein n=1 Tax=Antrihabitans stalactiti TaxID=2584121 RepID=A0A848KNI3_9NOCA|nr:hypothetical protein [Antrihabitans stalactiti]NMN98212.1 hypothetical protein [Antrihabitans stalactiti]